MTEGEKLSKYSDMVRIYNILEKDTNDLGSIIHFDERNLDTFGIRVYNLLFMSCNLFELAAKEIVIKSSGKMKSDMKDWKLDPIICQFSENKLTFEPMGYDFKPMEALGCVKTDDRKLTWWKDYNSVKHNLANIDKATLRNLIYALSSAGLLTSYISHSDDTCGSHRSILFDGLYLPDVR